MDFAIQTLRTWGRSRKRLANRLAGVLAQYESAGWELAYIVSRPFTLIIIWRAKGSDGLRRVKA